jgi:hypothetical protein
MLDINNQYDFFKHVKLDDDGNLLVKVIGGGTGVITDTFETVNKNLKSYPYTIAYTGNNINTMTYDLGGGDTIVKTFAYVTNKLSTITLSGILPGGVLTTIKTFTYTGNNITSVSYS